MLPDVTGHKEPLQFIFHNWHEQFEYLLNPGETHLNKA